jgi:hypothetical protein
MRVALLTTVASLIASVPSASAQTGLPKLEIGTRQGDYYWVVETSPDGLRRGGWVNIAVPLHAIDRNALKPLPPLGPPSTATSVQAPPPVESTTLDERLMRLEQALAAKQGATPLQEAPQVRPAVLSQISQPRPEAIAPTARPQTREGLWFSGGLGVGVAGCVGCLGREIGASGGLSLGGTISERVLLGVGTTGWYKSIDGVALTGGTFDARLRFYPAVSSGFFLTAGGGLGSVAVSNGFVSDSETGVGVLFGLGWDARVGRNVSLTPFYNGFAVGVDSGTFFVDQFGIAVTIH